MKYAAIIDGERVQVEVTPSDAGTVEAEVGDKKYRLEVKIVEPGVYWFHWNDQSIEISVTPDGDAYVVTLGNQHAGVEIMDDRAALRRAAEQAHAGEIELRAPMPGKVVKVLVAEGEPVEMNQGVVVIEAMKMQNEIKSPKKGIVRKLGVKESAAVNAGEVLAVVE